MLPNYKGMPADEVNDIILNFILRINSFKLIENFLIDMQIIQDFLPETAFCQMSLIPVTNLIAAIELIQKNGVGKEEID